jgi:hypothetical protein
LTPILKNALTAVKEGQKHRVSFEDTYPAPADSAPADPVEDNPLQLPWLQASVEPVNRATLIMIAATRLEDLDDGDNNMRLLKPEDALVIWQGTGSSLDLLTCIARSEKADRVRQQLGTMGYAVHAAAPKSTTQADKPTQDHDASQPLRGMPPQTQAQHEGASSSSPPAANTVTGSWIVSPNKSTGMVGGLKNNTANKLAKTTANNTDLNRGIPKSTSNTNNINTNKNNDTEARTKDSNQTEGGGTARTTRRTGNTTAAQQQS